MKTLKSLQEQYHPSKVSVRPITSFAEPRKLMYIDALKVIADRLASELVLCTALVKLGNERSRYFMIYEIVKTINCLGNRLSVILADIGAVSDVVTGERPRDEVKIDIRIVFRSFLLLILDISSESCSPSSLRGPLSP